MEKILEKGENSRTWKFIENFSEQTTVHGLNIVGMPKLHILERLFWVAVVIVAAGGAIALAQSNWNRYSANPTVVSLQKDFRNWENPFPAATGCFNNKLDPDRAEKFIYKTWGINSTDPKYGYYLDFAKAVANASYVSLDQFQEYQGDETLKDVNMVDLAAKVHPIRSGNLVTFQTKHKTDWTLILTEIGVCFTVNSKFAELLSLNNVEEDSSRRRTKAYVETLRCHYLNGMCYARYDSDASMSLKYYIHSYLDIVHITHDLYHELGESEELEINYRMIETESSPALRYLSPSQRRCRFHDEPITRDAPVYSATGKICDVKGLICLSKYADNMTQSPSQIGCKCPQPCDLIVYLPQISKYTKWEHGYFDQRITFRWGLLPPTTKYHRDILFGFEDLVVSIGGTVALFLGISFISVTEIFFLTSENIIQQCTKSQTGKKKNFIPHKNKDKRRRRPSDRLVKI